MDHQTFHIRHIGQQRKDLKLIDESMSFFLPAPDLKGKDGCPSVGKIFFIQGMVGMLRQGGMVYLFHLGVVLQECDYLFGIFRMAFKSQGKRLGSLKK